jgi:Lon protease-like protein
MAPLNIFELRFLGWIADGLPGGQRQVPPSLIRRGLVEVEEGEPFLTPAGCAMVIGCRRDMQERCLEPRG